MKKIFVAAALLIFVGCGEKRIINTYYGKYNIDSISDIISDESGTYYYVNNIEMDSIYYNPTNNKYVRRSFIKDNQGRNNIYDFNPEAWREDSIEYMKIMKQKYGDSITYRETFFRQ